jgi:hypothetical protein
MNVSETTTNYRGPKYILTSTTAANRSQFGRNGAQPGQSARSVGAEGPGDKLWYEGSVMSVLRVPCSLLWWPHARA